MNYTPFTDYATATIGSSTGGPVLKYTVPYRCMLIMEITQMESNGKTFNVYKPVSGDQSRLDYFISNTNDTDSNDGRSFGLTKIMQAGEQIWGFGDLSPFSATLHLFKLN
jgi:hypothetical protein